MSEEKLNHVWCESDDKFFLRIDKCGGWPLGKKYVAFKHSEGRECEFVDRPIRSGMWTSVASADDYYWWKVSQKKRDELKQEYRRCFARQMSRAA
jgi:hypothetical protein